MRQTGRQEKTYLDKEREREGASEKVIIKKFPQEQTYRQCCLRCENTRFIHVSGQPVAFSARKWF